MGIGFKEEVLKDIYDYLNKDKLPLSTDKDMLVYYLSNYDFKNNYTDLLEILKYDLQIEPVGNDNREKVINGLAEYFLRLHRILIQIQNDYVGVYHFKINSKTFLAVFFHLSDEEGSPPFVYHHIYGKDREFSDVELPKDLGDFLGSLENYTIMSYEKFEWFKETITLLSTKYKFKKMIRLMDTNYIEEFLK